MNDMNDGRTDLLAWTSPAFSLPLERVFDFYIEDCMPRDGVSVAARVAAARWLAKRVTGALRGSPEFRMAARRALGLLRLAYRRVAGLCVHRWEGFDGLDRPPDVSERGSVTLIVGYRFEQDVRAHYFSGMSEAIARASGRLDVRFDLLDVLSIWSAKRVGTRVDKKIDSHRRRRQEPHARMAFVPDEPQGDSAQPPYFVAPAEGLVARGFHVATYARPQPALGHPAAQRITDRVLVPLGSECIRYRGTGLAEHVAALVSMDPASLEALFAAPPERGYLWFEPSGGRFGPDHTVITLSRPADFATTDGSAPPLDPRQVL